VAQVLVNCFVSNVDFPLTSFMSIQRASMSGPLTPSKKFTNCSFQYCCASFSNQSGKYEGPAHTTPW